ncbi:MAG: transcriptional regulator, GntR family [Clostridiaceae bacterium]|jgi:K+/H+ antiporter YhaU regulatory subunit KhtT|nr:transcriptional regulator, GntR family [Clostridiaceae bacterium]
MEENIVKPVYQQIAIDLANRITRDEFKIGTKLHGRSTLAGQYNVSPETIRRAVTLLEDMNIVEVSQGRGITVKSIDSAFKFIEKFRSQDSLTSLKKNIYSAIEKRRKLDEELTVYIDKLIDSTARFKSSNPFAPIEVEIPKNSKLIGKTIGEVNFWQNTGTTIIGIRRNKSLILSPGPYATFIEGDVYIMIGDESSYERVKDYINE